MAVESTSSTSTPDTVESSGRTLTEAEFGLIENWVKLADTLGLPKSLAQIYGLIFISKGSVSAQDCVDILKMSRSSAGQGLKSLRDVGAIRPAFELGARREAFIIESDISVVIQGILKSRLFPAFEAFFVQMGKTGQTLKPGEDTFCINRLQKLEGWRDKFNQAQGWLLR